MSRIIAIFLRAAIAVGCVLALPQAVAYVVSIPDYEAQPGAVVLAPVAIDEANGLASITLQINFNPSVLTLNSVTAGELGEHFDLDVEQDGGVLHLTFTRAENLANGSGHLAILEFRTNAGATTDLFSELAIASFEVSDDRAVTDLSISNALAVNAGSIRITHNPNIDNAQNGLPDWWETEHGLNPLSNDPQVDTDGDSINQIFELAFGGNPNAPDDQSILPQIATAHMAGQEYAVMQFRRRIDDADGLTFTLYESTNLVDWNIVPIASVMVGEESLDDEMRLITVRSSIPLAPGVDEGMFLRLKIY